MIEILKNINYKNRILWYLLFIVFAPIIILGIFSYNTYVTEITNNVNLSTQATASQVKNRTDSVLINIKKDYLENYESDEIQWLLSTVIKYSDYSELVKATDVLDGSTYLSEYIDGFTFINFQTGWVLSNRGMYEYDQIQNQADIEVLYKYKADTLTRNFWLNRIGMTQLSNQKREMINLDNLSFVSKLPAKSKNPYALVIVNINQAKLQQIIASDLGDNEVTVIDSSGNLVYSTDKDILSYCTANSDQLKSDEVQTIKLQNGESYNIAVVDSEVMGWKYIVSYDVQNIMSKADNILSFSIVMGGIVVLGVLLSIFTTRRIYKPVSNLTNHIYELANENKTPQRQNEFDYIAHSIDNLFGKNTALEKLIASQQGQLTELFQLRLIRSEVKPEQMDYYFVRLNLKRKKYFSVISINVRSQESFEEYDEAKQDAVRIGVVENLPENISQELFMPAICNARTITMALTEDDVAILDEKIFQIYNSIAKYVYEQYNLLISAGASNIFEDLMQYRTAYYESVEALKNNEVFYKEQNEEQNKDVINTENEIPSSVMFYSDIMNTAEGYIYNILLERQIKEAVDLCDIQLAFSIIDKFMEELKNKKVSANECSFYLHRFMISIILIASNAGLIVNDVFGNEANNIFLSFNQIYDLDKMTSFYKFRVVTPIIQELSQFRTSRTSEIMSSIQALIEETKGDITLTECAEKLNYHPSYIWKVMKSEQNITFSDYIAEYRINEAKKLLTTTSLTVADIAATLNYTNTQNFIRFFSKNEGTTPGKYRQNYNRLLD
ncbi:MAG: helix-turn-helix transcriptional regulator [Lachnotalea sp.]